MAENDDKDGSDSATRANDSARGASNKPPFTLDEIKQDTKERLQRAGGGRRHDLAGTDAQDVARPIRAAYALIFASAILVGGIATLFLLFSGGIFVTGAARWTAPLIGTILFTILAVGLARSSTSGLR